MLLADIDQPRRSRNREATLVASAETSASSSRRILRTIGPVADLVAGIGTVVLVTLILVLADARGEQADIVGPSAVGELGGACAQDGDRLLR